MKYWFDSRNCVVKVDDEWAPFASENGAPDLTPEAVRGRHLSSFISDATTCDLWTRLLDRARDGVPVAVTIRCDAPDCRRTLTLRLKPDRRRVRVTSILVGREFRPQMLLLDSNREMFGTTLVACGWCRKFEIAEGTWVEVEELVAKLNLFAQPVLPPVSHGVCPSCLAGALAQLEREPGRE